METTNPNTRNLNEETLYTPEEETTGKTVKEAKGGSAWKAVVIGGIPGIALGVAGTLGTEQAIAASAEDDALAEAAEETQAEEQPAATAGVPDEIRVAEGVSDDMSFGEAFATARHELGAGGVFEWRGQLYSTYQKEEWETLSDEERHAFGQQAAGIPTHGHHEASAQSTAAEAVTGSGADDGPQIEILEVGTVRDEYGEEVDVARGTIDGHRMAIMDLDRDGTADIAVVDENDNSEVEGNEVYDLEGSGVRMSDLEAAAQDNLIAHGPDPVADNLYDGMPDYTNDADTSSFA